MMYPPMDGLEEFAVVQSIYQSWLEMMPLYRKRRTLNREMSEAIRAAGDQPSEENLARVRDVVDRLAEIDRTINNHKEGARSSARNYARSLGLK